MPAAASTTVGAPVRCAVRGGIARLVLARPERHNSLVPDLVDRLEAAIAGLDRAALAAVVLSAEGANFSTGGDLAGFDRAARLSPERLRSYADGLVGGLNRCIMGLLRLPVPVVAEVRGAVTGGAAGLVFAADFVLMTEDAWLRPYYAEVGFAPDGGWTALLLDQIGSQRALAVLALDERIDAARAVALGIATRAVPGDRLAAETDALVETLGRKQPGSIADSCRLIRDARRLAEIEARLDAERQSFVDRVVQPATLTSMRRFMAGMKGGDSRS